MKRRTWSFRIGYLLLLVPAVLLADHALGNRSDSGKGMNPVDSPGVHGPATVPAIDASVPLVYETASFGLG